MGIVPRFLFVLSSLLAAAVQPVRAGERLEIYVTDRGINQWESWRRHGASGVGWVMSDPAVAHIAVAMSREKTLSREAISRELIAQVARARKAGARSIEIQLIQDVSTPGYFDPARQELARVFGVAAYGAIADLDRNLRNERVEPVNRAIVGSNGATVFAASREAWIAAGGSLWHSVDVFDGRAYYAPMRETIRAVGAERMRIFNTARDWWGPYTPWAFRSVSNTFTTAQLKDEFPALRSYGLTALGTAAHIAGMSDANTVTVREYLGAGRGTASIGAVAARRLRPDQTLPGGEPDLARYRLPAGVPIWRDTAEDLHSVLKSYSEDFAVAQPARAPVARALSGAEKLHGLGLSVWKDIEASRQGPVVLLSSHTLEGLARVGLDLIVEHAKSRHRALQPMLDRIDATRSLVAGAAQLIGAGTMTPEAAQAITEGLTGAAKQQLLDAAEQRVQSAAGKGAALAASARTRLEHKLLLLDAVPDFAAAAVEHRNARGRLTVDVVDRYSDAVIKLSASVITLGLSEVPVVAAYASTFRDGLVAASRYARSALQEPTRAAWAFFALAGERAEVESQYDTYRQRRIHEHKPIESMSAVFGKANLLAMGFGESQIDRDGRGGVKVDVAPRFERGDLRGLVEEVRSRRPAEARSWLVP